PVAVPTATGWTRLTRPTTHPSGAISAPFIAIRCHNGGISSGRCRDRAIASDDAKPAAPAIAPTPAARAPRCPASVAPATPPIAAANPVDPFRSGVTE